MKLSAQDKQRYHRQIILPSWGEGTQALLKDSCVFVAGAGGLGSPVALYLAAAGVGILRICDSGEVELSNLNRQILHTENRIDENKANSAKKTLKGTNPTIQVVPLTETITSDNLASLVGEARLMIDCLDNFQTRYILNQHAVKTGLPFVHAGVNGLCGQIAFIHPPETACLACLVSEAPPSEIFPILGATAGLLGCLEALEALKYLTGTGELLKGRLLFCDGETMQFQEVSFAKDPACRVCGSAESG
ncbi:MAG: HesA/MoeB/ThiF family protein [Spirochaetaceae bacterium]|nr:MAG: HesA/MoeB/ThiF family protein [Spirochaetaceae bacterium]